MYSLQRASKGFPVFAPLPQVMVAAGAVAWFAWVLFDSWQLLSELVVVVAMIYLNSFNTQILLENFNSTFLRYEWILLSSSLSVLRRSILDWCSIARFKPVWVGLRKPVAETKIVPSFNINISQTFDESF